MLYCICDKVYNAERQTGEFNRSPVFICQPLSPPWAVNGVPHGRMVTGCRGDGTIDRVEGLSLKEFASAFYNSPGWKETRRAYRKSVGGLCELCLKEGRYTSGEIVHHKIPLDPTNINNPDITLSWDNLQLVCREHHAQIHDRRQRRYRVDELGRVTAL